MGNVSVGECGNGIEKNTVPLLGPKKGVDLCEPMWELVKVPIKNLELVTVQDHGLGTVTGGEGDGNQGGAVGANNEGVLLS